MNEQANTLPFLEKPLDSWTNIALLVVFVGFTLVCLVFILRRYFEILDWHPMSSRIHSLESARSVDNSHMPTSPSEAQTFSHVQRELLSIPSTRTSGLRNELHTTDGEQEEEQQSKSPPNPTEQIIHDKFSPYKSVLVGKVTKSTIASRRKSLSAKKMK